MVIRFGQQGDAGERQQVKPAGNPVNWFGIRVESPVCVSRFLRDGEKSPPIGIGWAIGIWGDRNVVAYPLPDRAGARGRAAGLLPALVVLRGRLFPGVEKSNTGKTRVLAAGEYSQARARCGPPSVREFCQLLPDGLSGIRDHFCRGRSG